MGFRDFPAARKEKCAASAQGDWLIRKRILLYEQSQPRHNDLNAGIWMRAVRRARQSSPTCSQEATRSYSQSYSQHRDYSAGFLNRFESTLGLISRDSIVMVINSSLSMRRAAWRA